MTPLPMKAYDFHPRSVKSLDFGPSSTRQEQPWTGPKVVQSEADEKTKTK